MNGTIAGFDWDDDNREKCQKHGVSIEAIEVLFTRTIAVKPDPSTNEPRYRAIGRTTHGRAIFLVFTLRDRADGIFIRPISARFMHGKEVQRYEEANPDVQDR